MKRWFVAFNAQGNSLMECHPEEGLAGLSAGGGTWTVVPQVAFFLLSNKTGCLEGLQPSNVRHPCSSRHPMVGGHPPPMEDRKDLTQTRSRFSQLENAACHHPQGGRAASSLP